MYQNTWHMTMETFQVRKDGEGDPQWKLPVVISTLPSMSKTLRNAHTHGHAQTLLSTHSHTTGKCLIRRGEAQRHVLWNSNYCFYGPWAQSIRIAMAMGRARGVAGSRSTAIRDTLLRYSCSDLYFHAKLVQSIFISSEIHNTRTYAYLYIFALWWNPS